MNKSNEAPGGPSLRHSWWSRNWFYAALISIAVIGSFCAFCLPLLISEPFSAGDSVAALRHAILAATGGVLAMLTLWENRRKNLQEKDKNDIDHTRQVKAERRSRYAKAIEQLADDKSTVRLGGIYTLAKLADEWLSDDKTVPSEDSRTEEAQIIINTLCSYIRLPFPLAGKQDLLEKLTDTNKYKGDLIADQFKLREEKEVRRTIFSEMSKRLSKIDENLKVTPGFWSHLKYDFNKSQIFYSLDNLSFDAPDFRDSVFYEGSSFTSSTFSGIAKFNKTYFGENINFSETRFSQEAEFSDSHFHEKAEFYKARFKRASFWDTIFENEALFQETKFYESPSFFRTKFCNTADFLKAYFESGAYFELSEFGFILSNKENERKLKIINNEKSLKFKFDDSYFMGDSTFSGVNFRGSTYFNGTTFADNISFEKSHFFNEAEFENAKSIQKSNPETEEKTEGKLIFSEASFRHPAMHDFRVSKDSQTLINMGVVDFTLFDGTIIRRSIPVDSYLFELSPPDKENKRDINMSGASESIEDSE